MQNSPKASESFFKRHAVSMIMWSLLVLIGVLIFSDFSQGPTIISEKINPYVLSTKGKTLIIRDKLVTVDENKQEPIFVGDRIKTINSTATVFWPDGSITRLGEKSSIKIHEMRAKTANESIQVDFSLETGKSWSNVIKYMFEDSYFHERFNNDTSLAAVRGTIFEVNLEHKYIHTIDHGVSIEDLKSHTGSILVVAGGMLDTDTRNALIKRKVDEAWNTANNNADLIYLNERLDALNKKILWQMGQTGYMDTVLQKIGLKKETLPLDAFLTGDAAKWKQLRDTLLRQKDSKKAMDIYQQFYGLENTGSILNTKMQLRDLILEMAPADKKQIFLTDFARSSLYDSWNTLQKSSKESLQKKLQEYIDQGANKDMIHALENAAKNENLQKINDTLGTINATIIGTLWDKNIMDTIKNGVDAKNIKKINEETDKIGTAIADGLKKFIQ